MSEGEDSRHLRRAPRVKKEMFAAAGGDDNVGGGDPYAAIASSKDKGEKRANVAGFLAKAFQIFDNPEWSDVCGWGQDGETVVIRKQVEFAQRILPLFFNHSNLQSFVRQLNMYNFRKVVQDPKSGEFRHDLFRKGNGHLLHLIKRKQSPGGAAASGGGGVPHAKQELSASEGADGSGTQGTVTSAGGIMKEADSMVDELVRLRAWRKDMENTVVELKQDNETLQNENQMLKGKVVDHANHQLVLQTKMQKILFCMYDVYITGLRNAKSADGGSTDLVKTDGTTGDVEVERRRKGGAGYALEKALQQLAALGEQTPDRPSLLDMEHPWPGGAGSGAATTPGSDGVARSPSAGSSSGGSTIITGGGPLAKNRTWSQSSYEWLRSLRDPDPMGSIGSSVDASPEESSGGGAAATSTNGGDGGVSVGSSPVGNSPIGRSPVSSVPVGSSPIGSSPIGSHPVGSHVDTPERPSKRQRMSPGAVTPPPTDGISNDDTGVSGSSEVAAPVASPSVTSPPTADADTDTDVDIDEGTGGGAPLSHIAPATASESVAAASAAMPAPAALIPNGAVNGVGAGFTRTPSFSPDAPISHATAAALGAGAPVMRTNEGSPKRSVAAAGGASDVWGGGELTRTLSEGATQVVSELGELGHCEGEALTKIDSLGYQLANLLDSNEPIMGFEDMAVFGDTTGETNGDGLAPLPHSGQATLDVAPVVYVGDPTAQDINSVGGVVGGGLDGAVLRGSEESGSGTNRSRDPAGVFDTGGVGAGPAVTADFTNGIAGFVRRDVGDNGATAAHE